MWACTIPEHKHGLLGHPTLTFTPELLLLWRVSKCLPWKESAHVLWLPTDRSVTKTVACMLMKNKWMNFTFNSFIFQIMCNVNFTVELNHHYNPKQTNQRSKRRKMHKEHNVIAPMSDACRWPRWAMYRSPKATKSEHWELFFFSFKL